MTNHHKTYYVPAHIPKDHLIRVSSKSNHYKDNFTYNNCELRLTPIQRFNEKVEDLASLGPQICKCVLLMRDCCTKQDRSDPRVKARFGFAKLHVMCLQSVHRNTIIGYRQVMSYRQNI